jgi:acetyltransferase-like isoleucine patch superfamily enzyme
VKRLIIIGAGAFGREVLNWALDIPSAVRDWEMGGFLDSNPDVLKGYDCQYPVLGSEKDYKPTDGDCFVCAIGSPGLKMEICEPMLARGDEFVTIIHPRATVGHRTKIGDGCIICPGAIVTTDAGLGSLVTVLPSAVVGDHATVGAGSVVLRSVKPGVSVFGVPARSIPDPSG